MRISHALALFALIAHPVLAEPVPERPLPNYPHTRATDLVEEQFGEKVADPFRWLENDVRTDPEVRNWVNRENEASGAYLKTLPGRDILAGRMKQLYNFERFGTPRKAGQLYFYTRNDGLQNQSILNVRQGLDGKPRVLIDPNAWAKDGATALAEWMPSNDGRHLLYAIQDGGTDWRTLKILDVATGATLDDEIKWVKFSSLAWNADSSGFYYSRFAEPETGATFQSINLNQAIYFHALGTPQSADVKIYATADKPKQSHSAQVTDDGRYLLITTAAGTDDRYELTVGRLDKGPLKLRTLVKGLDNNWELAGSVGSRFYFLTNRDAPRGRLVTLDADKPARELVEIVSQTPDTLVGASLVGERMILAYLGDAY